MDRMKIRKYYLIVVVVFFIGACLLSLTGARKMQTVKLFLKDRHTGNLVIQRHLIPKTSSLNEEIFWILMELISGPNSIRFDRIFDPNIEVKKIIVKKNIVYISFDWSVIESLYDNPSLAIRSIVNSILFNIRELKEVKILIEGIEPVSTFCNISLQNGFK